MPIYEYKCEHCNETFEVLQKFNEDPLTECVQCQKGPVKKLISASSFVLKGAGFYVNDYPKNNTSKKEKTTSSVAKTESKTETKTETKTTTKTE